MRPYGVSEILKIVGGRLIYGDARTFVSGVTSDSRDVSPGDLFCALVGERVDGHSFILDVFRKGAGGALMEHPVEGLLEALATEDPKGQHCVILVPSVVKALQQLATSYRSELSTKVIGITGSIGKTSTKDLICSVLTQEYRTFGNPGNLNSHVGLPLAVLRMDEAPEYAVLEMAMRKRGEITELCGIAKPEIGVLTDISGSHLGVLGSIEEIALAKSEILTALPPTGTAIVSGDNPWVRKVSEDSGRPVLFYGLSAGCDVRAVDVVSLGSQGSTFSARIHGEVWPFRLRVPGMHQIHNALAAVAIGAHTGIPYDKIRFGLENAVMSPWRLQVMVSNGITIINDAYNSSPKSARAALDLLGETGGGRRIAVLGDMLEMGDYGPSAHREVGEYARSRASYLAAAGVLGKEIVTGWDATGGPGSSSWFPDRARLTEFLKGFLHSGDAVLVKASRGMGFEAVVSALTGETEVTHGAC